MGRHWENIKAKMNEIIKKIVDGLSLQHQQLAEIESILEGFHPP